MLAFPLLHVLLVFRCFLKNEAREGEPSTGLDEVLVGALLLNAFTSRLSFLMTMGFDDNGFSGGAPPDRNCSRSSAVFLACSVFSAKLISSPVVSVVVLVKIPNGSAIEELVSDIVGVLAVKSAFGSDLSEFKLFELQ